MSTLTHLTKELEYVNNRKKQVKEEYKQKLEGLQDWEEQILTKINWAKQDLDIERIELGKSLVYVSDTYNNKNQKHRELIDLARADISAYPKTKMLKEYFGLKCYDRFIDQREDCPYGYGPRHGHICFRVGLTNKGRRKDLTKNDLEDALYYLYNIDKINNK